MKKKHLKWLIPLLVFVALSAAFFGASRGVTKNILCQTAAERWTGESGVSFAQLSAFMSRDDSLNLEGVYTFRQALEKKFVESSLEAPEGGSLYHDAWSSTGTAKVYNGSAGGDASIIAVGGDYFFFHPITLVSGSYLSEDDVMDDRVLLDRELAWKLFGGIDLTGLSVEINGKPFYVAGVIDRETDKATKKAYTGGSGLYMSYAAYNALMGEDGAAIDCYEIVMAQPVDGFAEDIMKNTFPLGGGDLINNSGRFSVGSIFKVIKAYGTRSMHQTSVIYPYWENAARYVEDWSALYLALAVVFIILPVIAAFVILIILLIRGKDYLEDKVPEWTDDAIDKIRKKQYEKRRRGGAHAAKK